MKEGGHNETLLRWREQIDDQLSRVTTLAGAGRPRSKLQEGCEYVLKGDGKRLRGLLTCSVWFDLSNEAARVGGCRAFSTGVAIETLHAASLVHDDLPALDNDDMRRGRASCHKAFGESTAILVGDALFGAALLQVGSDSTLAADAQARICKILAQAWWDLCLGQELDVAHNDEAHSGTLAMQQREITAQRETTVRLKTGALFGASVACGALCAGVRDALLGEYLAWGVRVGECFQALDDLDDGDRPEGDRAAICAECADVSSVAQALDERLKSGVTSAVLARIMSGASA